MLTSYTQGHRFLSSLSFSNQNRHQMQEESLESDPGGPTVAVSNNSVGSGETPGAGRSTVSSSTPTTKFMLTQNESRLVSELFAWLVEPCLAFIRREVIEMVSDVVDVSERRGLEACLLAVNPPLQPHRRIIDRRPIRKIGLN